MNATDSCLSRKAGYVVGSKAITSSGMTKPSGVWSTGSPAALTVPVRWARSLRTVVTAVTPGNAATWSANPTGRLPGVHTSRT